MARTTLNTLIYTENYLQHPYIHRELLETPLLQCINRELNYLKHPYLHHRELPTTPLSTPRTYQVGWAMDGFGVYGRYLSESAPGYDVALDDCGGHYHEPEGYHYHAQVGTGCVQGRWR